MPKPFEAKNADLAIPYFLPYGVFVLIASLLADSLTKEWIYSLQILLTTASLAWCWKRYVPFTGPNSPAISSLVGILAGLGGAYIWVVLLRPFVDPAGEPYSDAAFVLRLVAAGLLVPIFEEMLTRGYLLRLAVQWGKFRRKGSEDAIGEALNSCSIAEVKPGEATVWAIVFSTVCFTIGHTRPEYLAAIAYGLLMAGLWITRKDLLTCIIAHGTTNIALGFYARATSQWGLW